MSMITTATDRFHAWAAKDNNQLGWWLTNPLEQIRYHLADAITGLGSALSRLGHRIHDDVPGDFWHGYRDGEQMMGLYAAAGGGTTTREDVRAMFQMVGLPSDDHTLDRLGWKATA